MSPEALRIAIDHDLAQVHRYFRDHGEDPTVITPDFFIYWVAAGKTCAEMLAIASNRRVA